MFKLPKILTFSLLTFSLIVFTAITVEAINLHYFGNSFTLKKINHNTSSDIINGEMPVDAGFFTAAVNGKQVIAIVTQNKNGYLVKALYKENNRYLKPFYNQNITDNTWVSNNTNVKAMVLHTSWKQSFLQSVQFLTYQIRCLS